MTTLDTPPPEWGYKWMAVNTGYLDSVSNLLGTFTRQKKKAFKSDVYENIYKDVRGRIKYVPQPEEVGFSRPPERGHGDCDDFALSYYQSLINNDHTMEDIYFVIGKLADGRYHSITVARSNATEYALFDNMIGRAVFPMQFWHLMPMYAVTPFEQWIAGKPIGELPA